MIHRITLLRIYNEIKKSSKITFPLIASEVVLALSGFLVTVMIAHLGDEILAAHAVVWNAYLTSTMFFIGTLFATSILISQSFGAKDYSSIEVYFNQAILLAIIFTPIMIAFMWYFPKILIWTKQSPIVIELATPAFRSLIWAMIPLNIMVVVQHFFMGLNKAYLVTVMSIVSLLVEVFFFYVFLFGKLGFPKLGLAGVGYALTISFTLVSVSFLLYLLFSEKFKTYKIFRRCWFINLRIISEFIRLGLPLGFAFLIEVGLFAIIAIMMGKFGVNSLASYQIAYQYFMIASVILFALSQAVAIRASTEVGRNDRRSLKMTMLINLSIGLVFMMLFSIIYICFPKLVIGLDIDVAAYSSQALVATASKFLSIISVLIIINCILLVSAGALRALKDTKTPMIIIFIGFWIIAVPVSYVLGFEFEWEGVGILWGTVIGMLFSAVVLLFRFNRLSKHIDLKSLVTQADIS